MGKGEFSGLYGLEEGFSIIVPCRKKVNWKRTALGMFGINERKKLFFNECLLRTLYGWQPI